MAELLDELDDRKRAMVVLADFEGFTPTQIAEMTGTERSTVYTLLRRARAQLEQALAAREKRAR